MSITWIPFDWRLGSRQQLPPERRRVLCVVKAPVRTCPQGVGVGYLRYAAGDPDSPFFVMPGVHPENGVVTAWADCLPDDFGIPPVDEIEVYVSAVTKLAMLWGAPPAAFDREKIVADWHSKVGVEWSARRIAGVRQ